jgi:predicted naringenin-chalcone synthase
VSYIIAVETAVPENIHYQEEIAKFYSNSTDDELNKRKIRVVANRSGINTRHSVLKDFSLPPEQFNFFAKNKNLLPEPGVGVRMKIYKEHAIQLCKKAINKIQHFENIKKEITHVISVTCTGLFAPGLDIELIRDLELNPTTNRSSINFMGCNAAILALKQADVICKTQPDATVLIVCVELCTLHFQTKYSDDYILSNLIFSDGCAAVLVSSKPKAINKNLALEIKSFNSMIVSNGYKDMAWEISETGFMINLTSYISDLIKENIEPMLNAISLNKNEVNYWTVHPGGKRIIDDFAGVLKLERSKFEASYHVLKHYGNMSSPTILFVLKHVLENSIAAQKGETIFSAGFGPGLSIETMQTQYV